MHYFPSTNLAAAFDVHLARDPGAIGLVVADTAYTRREIGDLAERAVTLLQDHGVRPGSHVVVQYGTTVEDVALAVATARLGGTIVPIPKRLGVHEVSSLLDRSDATVFVHIADAPAAGLRLPAGAAVVSSRRIWDTPRSAVPVAPTTDDMCAVIGVTSGSTGLPKGVMHSWSSIAWTAERVRALGRIQPGEAVLMTGAGAGAPGFTFFTYMPLALGATIVRAEDRDPVGLIKVARDRRCVWSSMVPTMLRMMLDARREALGDGKLTDLRAITMGGGFMSVELIERARRELGAEVLRMYAMAECMGNASNTLDDDLATRNEMDGRPAPDAALAVFDDNRRQLPVGEKGEIGLKGPSLLMGYLGEPEGKSSLMTPDGFFLSGDIGRLDADGRIKVVGRKKDMINRGGYKIDPSEVEELIGRHPSVAKVAVVGFPDELYGERSCAVVELRPAAALCFSELTSFLGEVGLSKEKLPERLELRDALPLSPDGKILKAKVKAEIGTDVTFTVR